MNLLIIMVALTYSHKLFNDPPFGKQAPLLYLRNRMWKEKDKDLLMEKLLFHSVIFISLYEYDIMLPT